MTEPRRISTRYRGEPPPKKRAVTPTPPPAPATHPKPIPIPAEPIEEGLPVKLREGQPLPTLTQPQDTDISTKAFQAISESGVLAAAIERSRQKWMVDGVFDRYWSKPSKKKGTGEALQPAKESMTRLGSCSMIIEPHAFDITLYTVKDMSMSYQYPAFPPAPQPSYSQYSPYPQSTPYPSSYGAPFTGSSVPDQHSHPSNSAQTSLPTFREGFGRLDSQGPPPIYHPQTPTPAPAPESRRMSKSSSSSHEGRLKEGVSSDPVIQMLATRAASDPRLKSLMKIVAAGNASPEQLKEFQAHIDELNTLLKSPQSPTHQRRNESGGQYPAPSSEASRTQAPSMTAGSQQGTTSAPVPTPSQTAVAPIKTEPLPSLFSPVPPPVKARHPSNKSDIQSIVFDFNGTGDRFSFPRFSILDYLPGGMQVIVSFLIIRRGNLSASLKYKDTKSYYQPVTLRLNSHHPRLLEPLARVVASPDEVRKYMDSIFDKMNRADEVYLPMRLPRAKEEGQVESKDAVVQTDISLVKPFYEPPNSMMPWPA